MELVDIKHVYVTYLPLWLGLWALWSHNSCHQEVVSLRSQTGKQAQQTELQQGLLLLNLIPLQCRSNQQVCCLYIKLVCGDQPAKCYMSLTGPEFSWPKNIVKMINKMTLKIDWLSIVSLQTIILRDNVIRKHWWTIAYFYELNYYHWIIIFCIIQRNDGRLSNLIPLAPI